MRVVLGGLGMIFQGWFDRVKMQSQGSGLRARMIRGGLGSASIHALARVLAFLLGVVLARGLGAEGYGIYAHAFAMMSLLMVLAELGMPTLLLRMVAAMEARKDWAHLRGLLVRSLQIVIVAATVLAAMAALVLWQFSGRMPETQTQTLAWVMVLLPFAALTSTITAALRGLQHVVKALAVEMLVRPVLVLLGVGFIFMLDPDMRLPQYAMAVQLGATIAVLSVAALLLYRYSPGPIHETVTQYQTRQWLASAMPLTLIGGAGIINSQTDILMLDFFRQPEDVGIYRVATQAAVLVAFGLQAANAVIAPQFAHLYAQGDMVRLQRLVTASARVILLSALPVALTFILAGGVVAGWVFGPEFVKSHTPMAILAVGQLVNAGMGSVGFLLNMTGHEREVARTLLVTAGLNILLNLVLIPPFGMAGAAFATASSLVTWNIILYRITKHRTGINSTAFVLKG